MTLSIDIRSILYLYIGMFRRAKNSKSNSTVFHGTHWSLIARDKPCNSIIPREFYVEHGRIRVATVYTGLHISRGNPRI